MRSRCVVLALVLASSGAAVGAPSKGRPAPAVHGGGGDGLAAGNVIVRGDTMFQFVKTEGQALKSFQIIMRPTVEFLVTRWLAVGGFMRTAYVHTWANGAKADTGMLDFGPRVTAYIIPSGIFHPYIAVGFGYDHLFVPGPDGNGLILEPEVGLAIVTGKLGAFLSVAYDFRWVKCQGVKVKTHSLPFGFGFGARF